MTTSAHKTALINHTQPLRFPPSNFTGKERDKETGYGYFGARYMDHELMTMWLSVDPMADKYPNISPYAYCAWNPVKLVDPDGKDIVLSKSAQKIHEKYYEKKGFEKYTELYNKLRDDHSILIIVKEENDNGHARSNGANGILDHSDTRDSRYKNGCYDLEWGEPDDIHGGTSEHVFLEELYHAGQCQMKDGTFNLAAASTITSEYKAKFFAVNTSTEWYERTYDDKLNWVFEIPTEMQIIKTYDSCRAKEYLKYKIFVTAKDRFNNETQYKTGGHYENIPWN